MVRRAPLVLLVFALFAAMFAAPRALGFQEELPWPAKLGVRAVNVQSKLPVARQVSLVPDAATFLDEIGRWTPTARWPVLFEDDRFAPQFVRGFQPSRVVRRASVGSLPTERAARESAMRGAATRAWGADPEKATLELALLGAKVDSSGVAIASATDPAWTAAITFAAGRGMLLRFVDGDFGAPNDRLDAAAFARLDAALRTALDATGCAWSAQGDAIDAVALCRNVAAKAVPDLAAAQRVQLPANAGVSASDPLATTDCLLRDANGARQAMVTWIPGNEARSAYIAMSSLFIEPKDVWLLSGYGSGEGWKVYEPTQAADLLRRGGFATTVFTDRQATLGAWEKLLMDGFPCDVLVMNSSGDGDWFSLAAETKGGGGRGTVRDIPFFDRPVALHLIHSWSLTRPDDTETIGGRLLERGVYAYYGSVQEPFLAGFVPPTALAARWRSAGPFLAAARMLEGPFERPWRLTAIGDPELVLVPAGKIPAPRAELPPLNGEDVRESATRHLQAFATDASVDELRAALRDLALIGDDESAAAAWKAARARKQGEGAAREALGALFRTRSFPEFVAAFSSRREHDADERDMLWHLATPRLSSLDEATLRLLASAVRGRDTSVDLARLLPAIDRKLGRRASDRIVHDELERTTDAALVAKLGELLRRGAS